MRIDVVSIFPDYLAPLRLSLPGKAQEAGLLDVHVHDLRQWTRDRHRTVDDTPYGGGAGMVMKPEPWGEALDALAGDGTVLVVPTPSGERFTQAAAAELAGRAQLLFACGRYEGIDQRVIDHARTRMEVREVSLGDYVLNGGEVAALVVIEAVVRLLPGFMGNPDSLAEESHGEGGLLEYPVYTNPASWRGLEVPDVLLSGDHARIATWRHEQAVRRTAERRPDLLPVAAVLGPSDEAFTTGARHARRRRGDLDAPARLLAQRGGGEPHARRPSADRGPRGRAGVAVHLAHLRAARRGPARRFGPGEKHRSRHLGDRPADGGSGPAGPWAGTGPAGLRRVAGTAGGDGVRPGHRLRERGQPAVVQAGRLPAPR